MSCLYGSWINNYMHVITKVVSSNPAQGEVYYIYYYVMHFVRKLETDRGFSPSTLVSSTNKTGRHYIA